MEEEKTHKKILFCASAASHIINFHNIYFRYLNSMGFEVHAAVGIGINTANTDDSGTDDIDLIKSQKNFVLSFEKGKKFFKNLKTVFTIAKIIQREKYNIVSTHSMLAGLIGRLAVIFSCNKKVRVIHTCHGYLFNDDGCFKTRLMIFIEKFLSLRTDVLFVMNGDDYNIAEKYKLCRIIEYTSGMGIDIKKLNSNKLEYDCQKYNIQKNKKDKKYFLCVGEFSKRKNQENIIYAFSRFIRSLPDNLYSSYHLIFIGCGTLISKCKKLCERLGINNHVTFCGYVRDTSGFYKFFAHCVISASKFEGLPFNIMEALYYGKPVIASNVKGHKDLISDGFNGYLYEYNDDIQLFECFKKMADINIYTKLKNNAYLDEKYYFDNIKEKILNCYGNMQS